MIVTGVLLVATSSSAVDFSARVDLGVALPVSRPQTTYFSGGFQGTLNASLEFLPFLDGETFVGYAVLPATVLAPASGSGTALGFGLGARIRRPFEDNRVIPFFALGVGWASSQVSTITVSPQLGLLLRPSGSFPLLVGPVIRFVEYFVPAPVPNRVQYAAGVLSFGLVIELAPRSQVDSDGDGVPDPRDECPREAARSANGCPAAPKSPPTDADADGVADVDDRCPNEAEDRDGFQDADGCPETDNDQDGLADADDTCPRDAGPAKTKGCPDADDDGVADKDDHCARVAGLPEDNGCPKYKQVVVTEQKIEIRQKIFFAFGTTNIMPKSHPLLEEVARALHDRDTICVRVEGHTDSKGSDAVNTKLSQGRAESVRAHLVSREVASQRMDAKGYGPSLPLDDNATAVGRENNRRVEFVIIPCSDTSNR
jgi:outer membrane protein OmpA-like peptidoglycan-associated protein